MILINLFDIALLSVVLLCGLDMVRVLNPMDDPWKTLAYVLITIGSFGWINYDIAWHLIAWYALVLHAGFAVCSVLIMHNHHLRSRGTDHLISSKTLRYLATHRPTVSSPKR